jgi:hypothetical protein
LSSRLLSRNVIVIGIVIVTVILSFDFYGCETWSLTLRQEHRLRVFEDRFLRKIFGRKRDVETEEWRKLHSEEHHNLCSFPNITRQIKSRNMMWARHVARKVKGEIVYRVLVGKPEGKDHSEDQGVDGRMGSEWILGRLAGGVEWVKLAKDSDRW